MPISDKTEIDISRVHSKGRVQIPVDVRKHLGIEDGDKIIWYRELDKIYVEKVEKDKGIRYATER